MTETVSKPSFFTMSAITMPCSASCGVVRNRKSLSSRVVMAGEVEALDICGTPLTLETLLATGMVTPLDRAPTMPLTPSSETNMFAASTPACGLVWVSPTAVPSVPPSKPPPWLT